MSDPRLYDQDFYAWANEQAGLLRAGRLSEADLEHIAEEIECLGKREKRQLVNYLTTLLTQLLQWRGQPSLRCTSWRLTLEEQRNKLADHLADSPSLQSVLGETILTAYRYAILAAARETGFDRSTFPVSCPWSAEQIMDQNFFPEAIN